jgi:hypothetical protein
MGENTSSGTSGSTFTSAIISPPLMRSRNGDPSGRPCEVTPLNLANLLLPPHPPPPHPSLHPPLHQHRHPPPPPVTLALPWLQQQVYHPDFPVPQSGPAHLDINNSMMMMLPPSPWSPLAQQLNYNPEYNDYAPLPSFWSGPQRMQQQQMSLTPQPWLQRPQQAGQPPAPSQLSPHAVPFGGLVSLDEEMPTPLPRLQEAEDDLGESVTRPSSPAPTPLNPHASIFVGSDEAMLIPMQSSHEAENDLGESVTRPSSPAPSSRLNPLAATFVRKKTTARDLFVNRGFSLTYADGSEIPKAILDTTFGKTIKFSAPSRSSRAKVFLKIAEALVFHESKKTTADMSEDGEQLWEVVVSRMMLKPEASSTEKTLTRDAAAKMPWALATAKTVRRLLETKKSKMEVGAAASGLATEFTRSQVLLYLDLDLSERTWRAARWHAAGLGVGASLKPEVVRRNFRTSTKSISAAVASLTDVNALQRLAHGSRYRSRPLERGFFS